MSMMLMPVKTERVYLRETRGRKAMWMEAATRDGKRLSEWLRALADRRVREQTNESAG